MILGSLVLLGMNTLLPLLLTTGLLTGLAASARISWRRAFRFFRPFLLMFLFLWLLSGLSWSSPDLVLGPLSFSYAGLERGGISVLRFLLLIALGFLFTETTTGAPCARVWNGASLHCGPWASAPVTGRLPYP